VNGRGLDDGGHHRIRDAAQEQQFADRMAGPLEHEEDATDDDRGRNEGVDDPRHLNLPGGQVPGE
jgi:hypothetical protein